MMEAFELVEKREIEVEEEEEEERAWWEEGDDAENERFCEFFTRFGSANRCRLCPFMAADNTLFGKHIKEEHTECERYQCKFCVKEFFHVYKCMNHIKNSHHGQLERERDKCPPTHRFTLAYRNCYTVIPTRADFQHVRPNLFLYHQPPPPPLEDVVMDVVVAESEAEDVASVVQEEDREEDREEKEEVEEEGSKKKKKKSLSVCEYAKPQFSYSQLIYLAFKNSVEGCLFVSQVYLFIMDHFPYYRSAPTSWKNSIRHTLCGSKCFLKGPTSATVPGDTSLRKNMYWTLSPDTAALAKMEAEIDKVIGRNLGQLALTMPNPDNMALLQQGQLKKQYSRFGSLHDTEDIAVPQLQSSSTLHFLDPSSYSALSSDSSGLDTDLSSHFTLVDNGLGLQLQPMDDGQACMFYVYD